MVKASAFLSALLCSTGLQEGYPASNAAIGGDESSVLLVDVERCVLPVNVRR